MENKNTNNNTKGQGQNMIVSLILVVVFFGGMFTYSTYYKDNVLSEKVTENSTDTVVEKITNCGMSVTEPIGGSFLGSDFEIVATLDNSERDLLGCSWTAFEAQAGVAYVKDGSGNDIASPTPLSTVMEWMTEDPVIYSAKIKINNDYKGFALIIINEEDPSGEKLPNTISIPVTIK